MNKASKLLLLLATSTLALAQDECMKEYYCAGVAGDPHVTSFDGLKWDCQGQGEFVLAQAKTGYPLKIHGSFVNPYNFTGSEFYDEDNTKFVSQTRAAAFKIFEGVPKLTVFTTDVGEVYPDSGTTEKNWCPLSYGDGITDDYLKNTYKGEYEEVKKVKRSTKIKDSGAVQEKLVIDYGDDVGKITIKSKYGAHGCVLSVNFCLNVNAFGGKDNIVGIYGTPDGNVQNDWMKSTTGFEDIPVPIADKTAMRDLGSEYCLENWCVSESSDSMFEADYFNARTTECSTDYDHSQLSHVIEKIEEVCESYFNTLADEGLQPDDASIIEAAFAIECNGQALEECITECPENDISSEIATEVEDAEDDGAVSCSPSAAPSLAASADPTPVPTLAPTPGTPPPFGEESGTNGDPHFKTWKQEHFEYHGQCDMILAKDQNFADGLGLEVQIRTKLVRFWSYIKSAAIRIGDDILEVEGLFDPKNKNPQYWMNLQYQGKAHSVGGFPLTIKGEGTIKGRFEIDLSSKYPGVVIVISYYNEFVSVKFENGSSEAFGDTVGMLGNFKTGQTLARDGTTVLEDFYEYGSEWQVLPFEDMLFHNVEQPQFPAKCIEPEDPRGDRRRRLDESTVSESDAEKACASLADPLDRKDCIYDILATQDMGMVGAY